MGKWQVGGQSNAEIDFSVITLLVFSHQAFAGQGFIVTGERADLTQPCAPLGSFAPVEHQSPSPVQQEHLAPMLATHIETTALSAPQDTIVKVGHNWHVRQL